MISQEVALSEICDTGSGGTPSRAKQDIYYGGAIPWVKSGELRESVITETGESLTELGLRESSAKLLPPDTLLVALYGATVGRVGMLGIEAATNQAVCYLIPDDTRVERRYLYHALRSKVPYWLTQRVGGGQPNISQGVIKNTKIPLPPLSEQKRIAEILDRAESLRRQRRAALALLDELTQSIFLDMFGDPVTNPKGWDIVPLEQVVYYQEGPGVRKWQFRNEGIKLVNVGNIVNGKLVTENTERFLDPKEVEMKYKHFLLDAGDFVVAGSGVTWGKIAEVNASDLPLCLNTSMIRFRPIADSIGKQFLRSFVESPAFRRQIDRIITGSAQPNFGPSHLKRVNILLPPIALQSEFTSCTDAIENLKSVNRSALIELDQLFASLQHRAFRGEL